MRQSNGTMSNKKKKRSFNSDNEDGDSYYGAKITEDRYRAMLGEHIQKYRRRPKDHSSLPQLATVGVSLPRNNSSGSKTHKLANERRGGLYDMETDPEWTNDINLHKDRNNQNTDLAPGNSLERSALYICIYLSYPSLYWSEKQSQ